MQRVIKKLQNLINVSKLIPTALKNYGGPVVLGKKLLRIYHTGGVQAIKTAIVTFDHRRALSYEDWRIKNEANNPLTIQKAIKQMHIQPLISVIMPTYNANEVWLKAAIDSVINQLYPNWELCIADDASTNPSIKALLKAYQAKDARIKVVFRAENGHISEASNSALQVSSGDWIALLDHDDLITNDALFWVAKEINDHPQAGLIYTDEDKLDENGERAGPYFKCDFNYDLMLSHNLITHLGCYKADLVKRLGGFQSDFNGAQDYDLALRVIEKLESNQIRHIPRVLYHWRIHEESTASSNDSKPYAHLAAISAIKAHLLRMGVSADVVQAPEAPGMNRVMYALPEKQPSIDIIIPTKDLLDQLVICVNSIIERTTYKNYRITIVNNASENVETLAQLDRWREQGQSGVEVKVIDYPGIFNYSAINNFAVNQSDADYICLLNNDIEVLSDAWLSEMLSFAVQKGVGPVGARLWFPNDTLQHGGVILMGDLIALHAHKGLKKGAYGYACRANVSQSFSAVTAACLLVSRQHYLTVGGLDAENFSVAFNDIDFCLRLGQLNLRSIWTPYAELYHYESLSRGYETVSKEKMSRLNSEQAIMRERWGDLLRDDPAYSPNLTINNQNFSLARHSRVNQLLE